MILGTELEGTMAAAAKTRHWARTSKALKQCRICHQSELEGLVDGLCCGCFATAKYSERTYHCCLAKLTSRFTVFRQITDYEGKSDD
jgi:hypothetical protein